MSESIDLPGFVESPNVKRHGFDYHIVGNGPAPGLNLGYLWVGLGDELRPVVDLPLVGLLLRLRLLLLLSGLTRGGEVFAQSISEPASSSLSAATFRSTLKARKGWVGSAKF